MKEDTSEMDAMRKRTNYYLNAQRAHQEVTRRMKENNNEKGDQMNELDYKKLIAYQEVARRKIFAIKEEYRYTQKN